MVVNFKIGIFGPWGHRVRWFGAELGRPCHQGEAGGLWKMGQLIINMAPEWS